MKQIHIKFIGGVIVLILLIGCNIDHNTPILGEFIDTTPKDLARIHREVRSKLRPVRGTKRYTAVYLSDGSSIAGHTTDDGLRAWCSNYVVAVEQELLKAGYRGDQLKRVLCSMYSRSKPDHIFLKVVLDNGEEYIMDSNELFVITSNEVNKRIMF